MKDYAIRNVVFSSDSHVLRDWSRLRIKNLRFNLSNCTLNAKTYVSIYSIGIATISLYFVINISKKKDFPDIIREIRSYAVPRKIKDLIREILEVVNNTKINTFDEISKIVRIYEGKWRLSHSMAVFPYILTKAEPEVISAQYVKEIYGILHDDPDWKKVREEFAYKNLDKINSHEYAEVFVEDSTIVAFYSESLIPDSAKTGSSMKTDFVQGWLDAILEVSCLSEQILDICDFLLTTKSCFIPEQFLPWLIEIENPNEFLIHKEDHLYRLLEAFWMKKGIAGKAKHFVEEVQKSSELRGYGGETMLKTHEAEIIYLFPFDFGIGPKSPKDLISAFAPSAIFPTRSSAILGRLGEIPKNRPIASMAERHENIDVTEIPHRFQPLKDIAEKFDLNVDIEPTPVEIDKEKAETNFHPGIFELLRGTDSYLLSQEYRSIMRYIRYELGSFRLRVPGNDIEAEVKVFLIWHHTGIAVLSFAILAEKEIDFQKLFVLSNLDKIDCEVRIPIVLIDHWIQSKYGTEEKILSLMDEISKTEHFGSKMKDMYQKKYEAALHFLNKTKQKDSDSKMTEKAQPPSPPYPNNGKLTLTQVCMHYLNFLRKKILGKGTEEADLESIEEKIRLASIDLHRLISIRKTDDKCESSRQKIDRYRKQVYAVLTNSYLELSTTTIREIEDKLTMDLNSTNEFSLFMTRENSLVLFSAAKENEADEKLHFQEIEMKILVTLEFSLIRNHALRMYDALVSKSIKDIGGPTEMITLRDSIRIGMEELHTLSFVEDPLSRKIVNESKRIFGVEDTYESIVRKLEDIDREIIVEYQVKSDNASKRNDEKQISLLQKIDMMMELEERSRSAIELISIVFATFVVGEMSSTIATWYFSKTEFYWTLFWSIFPLLITILATALFITLRKKANNTQRLGIQSRRRGQDLLSSRECLLHNHLVCLLPPPLRRLLARVRARLNTRMCR